MRPIHFLFAWMMVLPGLVYVVAGLVTRHFRTNLLPAKSELKWRRISDTISAHLRWKRTTADEVVDL